MTDYLKLAQDLVNRGMQNATEENTQIEVYVQESKELSVRVSNDDVEQLQQANARGIGIRVIIGGKVGYAYTSDFSEKSLQDTLNTALELAEIATPDPNRVLPELQEISHEDLEIYDPELENASVEDKIAVAKTFVNVAREADPRILQVQANYGDDVSHVYLANSNGFAEKFSRSVAYTYGQVFARGENDQAMGMEISMSNHFRNVDAAKAAKSAAYKATITLGAAPVPTEKMSVIFDPFAMVQIIMVLSAALSAQNVQRGRSFLMGKLGQEIGTDKITLLDNGRMKGGLASAPFDAEGVPTRATRLVDEGVLQNWIYDSYSARLDDAASTGNAQRDSYRSMPALGPSNFYIQPGHISRDELIAGVDKGLYVTNIMQTGGINPVTGDCSMAASGQLIENGKFTQPVNGVTVATTLGDLLKNVTNLADDLQFLPFGGMVGSPTVRVDNVTVGGTK